MLTRRSARHRRDPRAEQGTWSPLILGDLDPSAPHHAPRRAATPTRSPKSLQTPWGIFMRSCAATGVGGALTIDNGSGGSYLSLKAFGEDLTDYLGVNSAWRRVGTGSPEGVRLRPSGPSTTAQTPGSGRHPTPRNPARLPALAGWLSDVYAFAAASASAVAPTTQSH